MSIVTYKAEVEMAEEYSVQRVLELACAAQRTNKGYLKDQESVFDNEGKFLFVKHTNKSLIRKALGLVETYQAPEFAPMDIFVEDEDKELAEDIRKYYRRLMFAAVKGDNEFQTEVNVLLNAETMSATKVGFIACLPSVYRRDYGHNLLEKKIKTAEDRYLAERDTMVFDKDCEILSCQKSKNFDAFNIDAIIDNVIVSWMSKIELKLGAAVVIKAKVKDHTKHWKFHNSVTRLNYVKVAQ
jgi:hypothetical protein